MHSNKSTEDSGLGFFQNVFSCFTFPKKPVVRTDEELTAELETQVSVLKKEVIKLEEENVGLKITVETAAKKITELNAEVLNLTAKLNAANAVKATEVKPTVADEQTAAKVTPAVKKPRASRTKAKVAPATK